jgi:hypothetical protein
LLGKPIPGRWASRFPLLRNVRVAGMQFLIPMTVRGAGGDGVHARVCTTALLRSPRRCGGLSGSASRHLRARMDGLDRWPLIGRIACARACVRDGP